MNYIITENQLKKFISGHIQENKKEIKELKLDSGIVKEFFDDIKDFEDLEGMAKSLDFPSYKALREFIANNHYPEFSEIRSEAKKYIKNHKNKSKEKKNKS